jgi:large subunit ribosomal protein L35
VPKQKTHRGAAKRFGLTATGKVKRHKSGKGHILTKKSRKRKRNLRKPTLVDETDELRIKKALGVG